MKSVLIGTAIFALSFSLGLFTKMNGDFRKDPWAVKWDDTVGSVVEDLSYGDQPAQKFDLYVPAGPSEKKHSLVAYLHAGGFTSGDKSDDRKILEWLCSKGYTAAGINYTLRTDGNPNASVATQAEEIKKSIPAVIEAAKEYGIHIDQMAIAGGSAGHALAMIYGWREASSAPVPVKMIFGAVGPSSFYAEDWINLGQDPAHPLSLNGDTDYEQLAALFSALSGQTISASQVRNGEYLRIMKEISAEMWIDENSAPSVFAYGAWDRVQPFLSSRRLDQKLTENGVEHAYIVLSHSGHGLQNDAATGEKYMKKVEEYLDRYLGEQNLKRGS